MIDLPDAQRRVNSRSLGRCPAAQPLRIFGMRGVASEYFRLGRVVTLDLLHDLSEQHPLTFRAFVPDPRNLSGRGPSRKPIPAEEVD